MAMAVNGNDGGRACLRLLGYESRRGIADVGERLHCIPPTGSNTIPGKMRMRDQAFICIGSTLISDEAPVRTPEGGVGASYIRRLGAGESWDRDLVHRMQGRHARKALQY